LLYPHDRTLGHREKRIVNERILVVEANAVLGAVVEEVLQHGGYEVILMRTLLTTVERFDSLSAVILDSDTTSPEKELVWLGVLQPNDVLLPIVLMGLQVPQELRHRLRLHLAPQQTNGLTVLQKPFRNGELLAAVQQAHESSLPGQVNGR
jgi:DNA-binding response OmpR family regulator